MADHNSLSGQLPAETRMYELLQAMDITQVIAVAARLGVADLLALSPRSADELAHETKTHAPFTAQSIALPRKPRHLCGS